MAVDFREVSMLRYLVIFCRFLFSVSVALLVAGGCLAGEYDSPNLPSIGVKLVKAGYIVVAVIFAALLAFQAYFWMEMAKLSKSSLLVSRNQIRIESFG